MTRQPLCLPTQWVVASHLRGDSPALVLTAVGSRLRSGTRINDSDLLATAAAVPEPLERFRCSTPMIWSLALVQQLLAAGNGCSFARSRAVRVRVTRTRDGARVLSPQLDAVCAGIVAPGVTVCW